MKTGLERINIQSDKYESQRKESYFNILFYRGYVELET